MDVEKERYCQGLFDFGGELFGMVTRWVRSSLDEGFLERFRDTTDVVCFLVRQSQHTLLTTWCGIGLYDLGRKKDKKSRKPAVSAVYLLVSEPETIGNGFKWCGIVSTGNNTPALSKKDVF
mmetsp:Transcript_48355/g.58336  ORF Transcript_48355/g.58336 Transcript_48355/m.58336 type:complete len:121 (+) Transcript_48355:149-511(+)